MRPPSTAQLRSFRLWRLIGTVGALLIGVGGLGAGAVPVVNNPYINLPLGPLMSRMLQSSSALVLIGVGLLVFAWLALARFVGASLRSTDSAYPVITPRDLTTTLVAWTLPLLLTAPLFTQDIYSYLANGSIVAQGLSPYEAGPVQLLGANDPLARSVPFIWAQSPSPYGPVALGIAAIISHLTSDGIVAGVFAHRLVSLAGVIATGWAVTKLSRRCGIAPTCALWLGILNPVVLLHLIGGIHNESILLGFLLVGIELGLRGLNTKSGQPATPATVRWPLIILAGALISCAGMVKVTGFIGLGFVGIALARTFAHHGMRNYLAVIVSAAIYAAIMVTTIAIVTVISGIDLGWISTQGGATSVRSWLSPTTVLGVISGFVGSLLGLGDHTDSILIITRSAGIIIAGAFLVRMLYATFRGSIHPVGGLGMATLVLVFLFPVVHPWYFLWAVIPLAVWANRAIFRLVVTSYSAVVSFLIVPRGLALPVEVVIGIYSQTVLALIVLATLGYYLLQKKKERSLQ